jgi:hypothetical protein
MEALLPIIIQLVSGATIGNVLVAMAGGGALASGGAGARY